jgi:hypothetical protein
MLLRSDIAKTKPDRKILRRSPRKIDKISSLPNCILLYIMTFLSTQEAIQTSVLSKRWKNLWKYLSILITKNDQFRTGTNFRCFVNKVLSNRDRCSALNKIVIDYDGFISFQITTKLFKYGMSHSVEKIKINAFGAGYYLQNIEISNIICSFIKHLNLSFHSTRGKVILSNTLDLPELTYCRLKKVSFSSNDENSCVDPFSGCKKLITLIIDCCSLIEKQTLLVSNDQLSKLIIRFDKSFVFNYKIQMHTPNLKSFAFAGSLGIINCTPQLFDHNLKFLEEVSLELLFPEVSQEIAKILMRWLKMFNNVYSMTLASPTIKVHNYFYMVNYHYLILAFDPNRVIVSRYFFIFVSITSASWTQLV